MAIPCDSLTILNEPLLVTEKVPGLYKARCCHGYVFKPLALLIACLLLLRSKWTGIRYAQRGDKDSQRSLQTLLLADAERETSDQADGRVLLPDAVLPSRYEIRLVPDLERFVFDGHVAISVDVRSCTSTIVLHAKELTVARASFAPGEDASGKAERMEASIISHGLKETILSLTFPEALPVGPGVLEIDFAGILNDKMMGFYRSSYKDYDGIAKKMASTQFEPIEARRCFPCWDEPNRKAVFAVTLVIDPMLTAFSNMPERTSRDINIGNKKRREISFMDSPKMSTYLVAFVVGEFDFVQGLTKHGVLIRVYTPPGRAGAAHFALDSAVKCLDHYDDFFGQPYPLPKLDMVAIPEFAMGAMENWGLVTYREVDLLIDQSTASGQQKQRVCSVVTHELAHQWFGNLVTMDWWNDLWLNEGFATWCQNFAAHEIHPDYGYWDQFPDMLESAMRLDSLKTSHPIQVPIKHAEEVEEVFDAISYLKGSSVVAMAHAVLGHSNFSAGLQRYMEKHKYSNTETSDLWNAWAEASGTDVKTMMSSWTDKMGFPVVKVKNFELVGSNAKLSLEQSWFLSSGEDPPEERVWKIPLFIRSSADKVEETGSLLIPGNQPGKAPIMMDKAAMELEVPVGSDTDSAFVLINEGVRALIRVAYTPEMQQRLANAVRKGWLPAVDRAGLIKDAYALAKAGRLGADDLLKFLSAFSGEREYVVWDALSQVLLGLQTLLMGGAPDLYKKYTAFAEKFVWTSWETVNVTWVRQASDGHTTGLLRGLLVKLVSRFAAGPTWLAEARRRFENYVQDPQANKAELPDEYIVPVFQAVLQHGGQSEFEQLMGTYRKLATIIEKKHVYASIGFTSIEKLKTQALDWAIGGEVPLQDFFYIIMSVSASSKTGLDLTWKYFQAAFDKIHRMVAGSSPSIMNHVIEVATSGFCSSEKAAEVEHFFDNHPLPLSSRTISQTLEKIRASALFLNRTLSTDLVRPGFWDDLMASIS